MAQIRLIPYGQFHANYLSEISIAVETEFQLRVRVEAYGNGLSKFLDEARQQYDGNKILCEMRSLYPSEPAKTIGLFEVDLFIPIMTFIFGQAIFGGNLGIASCFRLRNELYGLTSNEKLLLARFNKVVIHELGHSFGLKHCHNAQCVMSSSTYVENLDQKERKLCFKCRMELELARTPKIS